VKKLNEIFFLILIRHKDIELKFFYFFTVQFIYSYKFAIFEQCIVQIMRNSEPEFLKILKCNSAESVSAGFQFSCFDIFNNKTFNKRYLDHFSGLLKFNQKNFSYEQTEL
jgi:hypothetical protein